MKFANIELRVEDGAVEARGVSGGLWLPVALQELRRRFPAGSPEWAWLAAHGVARPGRSGPSGTPLARADRGRKKIELSLSDAARARLDELAAGTTRSAVVEALILRAK